MEIIWGIEFWTPHYQRNRLRLDCIVRRVTGWRGHSEAQHRRNDWRTENVHLGEEKAMEAEADNCLENSERLSCEKGTRCIFYGPAQRSRMAKMRENFLFLNSN